MNLSSEINLITTMREILMDLILIDRWWYLNRLHMMMWKYRNVNMKSSYNDFDTNITSFDPFSKIIFTIIFHSISHQSFVSSSLLYSYSMNNNIIFNHSMNSSIIISWIQMLITTNQLYKIDFNCLLFLVNVFRCNSILFIDTTTFIYD